MKWYVIGGVITPSYITACLFTVSDPTNLGLAHKAGLEHATGTLSNLLSL